MIETIKQIAKQNDWRVIIASGELIPGVLTKACNDIINDSHFRTKIVQADVVPPELELVASVVCEKDDEVIAMAGECGGKLWGVVKTGIFPQGWV